MTSDGVDPVRRELLARVAEWYYLDQASQQEIARRLDVSRSSVSRLLSEARRTGVVEIKIHPVAEPNTPLADRVRSLLGLDEVVVVDGADTTHTLVDMGKQAARLAERVLGSECVMGITYGTSVYEAVRAIRTSSFPGMKIVQMAGVEGAQNPLIDGWQLVRMCGDRLGADYHHLHAPLFVRSKELWEAFLADPETRKLLGLVADADLAVVGIGSMLPERSSLVRAGHLTAEDLKACETAGSVGYIAGRHYDRHGAPIAELNDLTISLPLEKLRDVRRVIGVAGGADKARGIRAAAAGGFIDVLVTDASAANALLDGASPPITDRSGVPPQGVDKHLSATER